ncbi:TPA: hypothetical protein DEP21_03410 [Patescibacteria group bacterium]|nr:hypothetical protein [Candidatus Gracilibacteria bacterium]
MLFAALVYNNFLSAHQTTEDLWSSFNHIKTTILELLPNSEFTQLLTTQDPDIIKQINEHQLRWDKEFENHSEEKKYALVKQTLAKIIQSHIQQIVKNPHTSHEKKQEILQLNKLFSSK